MGILSKIFSSGAGELVDKVKDVADEFHFSGEEKEAFKQKMTQLINEHEDNKAKLAQNEIDSYLRDTQSARDSNVKIQTAEKPPLFIKVTPYAIACLTGIIWGSMTVYIIASMMNIIKRDPGVNFEGVLGIYAGITGTFGVVLNFFFGTSKSSEDKNKMVEKAIATNRE